MNKLSELHELLYDGATADCFCITESWLHDEISNGMLDPKSMFSIYRSDRVVDRGGGVCVLINHSIKTCILPLGLLALTLCVLT